MLSTLLQRKKAINMRSKLPQGNKNAFPPGTLDHIDFKKPLKWELKVIAPYGRCLVAIEDIKEGEILFVDHPIVTGPKQNCEPLCLGCYKQLDTTEEIYQCSKCGWPMCGLECENKGYHNLECEVYVASGYKPQLEEFADDGQIYEPILPLRCLLLEGKYPKRWETLSAMESHDELRKNTELWHTEQKNVVEYLQEKVKVNMSADLIHRVTGVLDVNCHEVRSNIPDTKDEFRVRGLYPLCAMMSHDCSSNTHHTVMDDLNMLVLASRDIKKGSQITGTYTHLLSGTIERRKHLKYGKFFDCVCDRCKDPTELGTYFSAFRCSKNHCGGNIVPRTPLQGDNMSDFVCDKCNYEIRCGIVNRLTNMIYAELQQVNENDPLELEIIFKKYQSLLHPNHYHLIGLKHSLGQLYGRVRGFHINELSAEQMQRKIDCCRDVIAILDVLDPGISRLRGLTFYELHAPLLLRANRYFQNQTISKVEFLKILNECLDFLDNAIKCLRFEPDSSFEGQICKIARGSKDELAKWIETVENLPESRFMPTEDTEEVILDDDITLESLLKKIEKY